MFRKRAFPGLLLAVFSFSCNNYSIDSEKLKQQIIAADTSMSNLSSRIGFNKALLQFASDDFVKFQPDKNPLIGKSAFAKLAEEKPGVKTISWQPVKAEVAKSGE